jgi:hypothetical protein
MQDSCANPIAKTTESSRNSCWQRVNMKAIAIRLFIEEARGIGTRIIVILILQCETKAKTVFSATDSS